MRSHSIFRLVIFAALVCVAVASCDQRPIDVVPQTNRGHWRTVYNFETEYYADLDGVSSAALYGVASESGLIHYDGTGWSVVGSPEGSVWRALSVVSASEIYAVDERRAYRFDGATWTTFYEKGSSGPLLDIWTLDGSSVFVAGSSCGVIRFDASLAPADSAYARGTMVAVWGSSQSDVFAVGSGDSILHYDGSVWTALGTGAVPYSYLTVIHGVGPDEVYAVGWPGLFERYDGTRWSGIELPEGIDGVGAVWAAAPNEVYLFHDPGGITRFDGSNFESMNSGTGQHLVAAWGDSPDDIIAVGSNKKTVRFDGSEWRSVSGGLPTRPTFLWGLDARNVYIAETYTVFRYDGVTVEELPRADEAAPLSALWGTSPDRLVAVGNRGAVFHFDGSAWKRAASSTSVNLHAVTGNGSGTMYAAGGDRTVVRFDGSRWGVIAEDPGSGIAYHDVWCGNGMVYVVGGEGSASRFNGVVWEALDTGLETNLFSVWGTAADNVYAAGQGGVLRFDGKAWRREQVLPYRSGASFYGLLTGSGRDDVFVVAEGYEICHFNGELWSPLKSDLRDYSGGLWMAGSGRLYAVSRDPSRLLELER
jgi:hypothetical protein